ncbi:nitrate reductase [Pseudoxanthomonas wuyuanensis]|uniref:nitrate reductase (cytochrome) n=1 Tax=Pseudoxanthomonas wuyuanensis TaxID=1073196 RepID=A0A286CZ22_9GAMM|nr:nitrate reductase [Pseudoxanthomonas wuyuanensis]KAF1722264.1 nitrate reductase [Pseudoxanthomonas wuyuanensis]SOD51650.1 assimilatory nitrate reductase (NADH) alpha subunit apoprotein [Pseudoxanthomonas wuyuanensis]
MDGTGAPVVRRTRTSSTCCYCGVGCGVLIDAEHVDGGPSRIVGIEGDPEHPANFGRLCTKGRNLPQTSADPAGRLTHPELRRLRNEPRHPVDWAVALDTVADRLAGIVQQHGPDAVAFYVSGQLLTEDYYVFNKLAKGLLGTNNIDTNSRLCMSSAVAGYKLALGADGPPTCYEDLELARTVLFAGSNMAYAHPVLFRRLEDARERDPEVRWIVIDPRRTDTAAMADLHLAIQPGTDVALFNGMLHHLIWEGLIDSAFIANHTEGFAELKQLVRDYTPRMAADLCGVALADLIQAAEWFGRSPAALSLYCMGLNQSAHGTDKNLALIHLHLATGQIGRPGAGPFSLTGQPNAMGGREVGGMATMLAAHREIGNEQHRAEVEQLWGLPAHTLSAKPGLSAVPLFEALRSGQVKAVWIACTNPVHSMPDIGRVREALQHAEYVIVQEAFRNTDTVPYADVLLPAATWGEKEGTVTNSERRISRVRQAVAPPGQAQPDWWIANEVARRIEARLAPPGVAPMFEFKEPSAIFDEHRSLTVGRDLDIGGIDYARLEAEGPQQWPFAAGAAAGQARRYGDGVFATASGKARFHVTPYRPVAEPTSARFPLRLLTGRLRDQWHGMSRTGRVPGLFAHSPEPGLRMQPEDAARRGLAAGELVRVISKRGELVLPLELSDEVNSGTVFAAMHWSGQFLSSGGINEVSQPAVDARSLQPELKHAAVRVEKAEFGWHLLAARRGDVLAMQAAVQPLLKDCGFAAIGLYAETGASEEKAWLALRAAAESAPAEDWLETLIQALDLASGPDTLEYRDARRGLLKRVGWRTEADGSHIDGLLLTDAQRNPASESLLDTALSGRAWSGSRLAVFAQSGGGARDPVVCNCMQVRESQIRTQVAQGAGVVELKQRLGCGTVCGSCLPQLAQLCRQPQRA